MAVETFLFIVNQLFYTFMAHLELRMIMAAFYPASRAQTTGAEINPLTELRKKKKKASAKAPLRF